MSAPWKAMLEGELRTQAKLGFENTIREAPALRKLDEESLQTLETFFTYGFVSGAGWMEKNLEHIEQMVRENRSKPSD